MADSNRTLVLIGKWSLFLFQRAKYKVVCNHKVRIWGLNVCRSVCSLGIPPLRSIAIFNRYTNNAHVLLERTELYPDIAQRTLQRY